MKKFVLIPPVRAIMTYLSPFSPTNDILCAGKSASQLVDGLAFVSAIYSASKKFHTYGANVHFTASQMNPDHK